MIPSILTEAHQRLQALKVKPTELPNLLRYIKEDAAQRSIVASILENFHSPRGKLDAQRLYMACVLAEDMECVGRIISRFLFMAKGVDELRSTVALASTLMAYYPGAINLGVKQLVTNLDEFTSELGEMPPLPTAAIDEHPETRFVNSLVTLITWHRQKGSPHAELYQIDPSGGELHTGLMRWCLLFVGRLLASENKPQKAALSVLTEFLRLMELLATEAALQLQQSTKLVAQFAGLNVLLLRLLDEENYSACALLTNKCVATAGCFHEQGVRKIDLLAALTSEALMNHSKLFEPDSMGMASVVSVDPLHEQSLLKQLRSTPFKAGRVKSAAAMAHTGELHRKRARVLPSNSTCGSVQHLRMLTFTNAIERLIDGKPEMHGALGSQLCECLCLDGLTLVNKWGSWDVQKELLPRFIESAKQLDQMALAHHLLALFDEPTTLGYVLPIVKARFGTLLGQLENSPIKESPVLPKHVKEVDEVLTYFTRASILPQILPICLEVIDGGATNYEAYLLMAGVWRVIELIYASDVECGAKADDELETLQSAPGSALLSLLVAIIQRHICELGHLMQQAQHLFVERPEEDWS